MLDEVLLRHTARNLRAMALDQRETQSVCAVAEVHEAVVDASAGQCTRPRVGEHLEHLLLASDLLALAVHDAKSQLHCALAQRQTREGTRGRRADGHTKLIVPLGSAASTLVR